MSWRARCYIMGVAFQIMIGTTDAYAEAWVLWSKIIPVAPVIGVKVGDWKTEEAYPSRAECEAASIQEAERIAAAWRGQGDIRTNNSGTVSVSGNDVTVISQHKCWPVGVNPR